MSRVRRCAGLLGNRCHEPATRRVSASYLGQPADRDVLFCTECSGRVHELVRPGWEITNIEPIELPEEVTA